MHFVIFTTDKPDHVKVRDGERPRHHAYVHDPGLPVRVRVAGTTLGPDSATGNGSFFIIEAEDLAAAQAFLAGDPYNQSGLYETAVVRAFRWDIGRPGES